MFSDMRGMSMKKSDAADLKTQLLCCGIRLPEQLRKGRKGGAGPAGGKYMVIGSTLVNVPVYGAALKSPFSVKTVGSTYRMDDDTGSGSHEIHFIKDPHFYQLKTDGGIPYRKIALLHGRDCLATTIYQKCIRQRKTPCTFCGIELSLHYGTTVERKTPSDLAKVAEAAKKEGVSHITLTTGTPNEKDKGALLLEACCTALKNMDFPIHVQLEPVERKYVELLKNSGADTIGIHIETPDESVFGKVCPGKDFSAFKTAWRDAVDVFGENQVSSYVLVGLGETDHAMSSGIEEMVRMGIIPYVVPFRPISGTPMARWPFPSFKAVKTHSCHAARMMKEYGLNPFKNRAGCVRCGACSPVKDYSRTL